MSKRLILTHPLRSKASALGWCEKRLSAPTGVLILCPAYCLASSPLSPIQLHRPCMQAFRVLFQILLSFPSSNVSFLYKLPSLARLRQSVDVHQSVDTRLSFFLLLRWFPALRTRLCFLCSTLCSCNCFRHERPLKMARKASSCLLWPTRSLLSSSSRF